MKKSFKSFIIFILYIFAVLYGLGNGILGENYTVLPVAIILGILAIPAFKDACKAIFGDKTK